MLHGSQKEKESGRTTNIPASVQHVQKAERAATLNVPSATTFKTLESNSSNISFSKSEAVMTPNDVIIQELGKALDAAREETAALKQQLERVKQDAQASVEISKFQASEAHRHATPEDHVEHHQHTPQQSDDEMDDQDSEFHRPPSAREEDLINQNHDLRYRLAELQDQLPSQAQPLAQPIHSDADWDALTLRLHETEKESHSRLQQLLSLKSSISSLTRTDAQISDSQLAETFSQLANRVREWVVSNYRRTKMSFDGLPDSIAQLLQSIKVDYRGTDGADKLTLYQAIVSRMLMRIFHEPLVIGMPEHGFYTGLRAFAEHTHSVGVEFREWRRATVRLITKSTSDADISRRRNDDLMRMASQLEIVMSSITSIELTPHARSALLSIMSLAADLQRILCLQKADYRVTFLDSSEGQKHHFDDHTMEPINDPEDAMDENSESHVQREFAFCVFPCLEKHDDEFVNIIFKARVCCGVG